MSLDNGFDVKAHINNMRAVGRRESKPLRVGTGRREIKQKVIEDYVSAMGNGVYREQVRINLGNSSQLAVAEYMAGRTNVERLVYALRGRA